MTYTNGNTTVHPNFKLSDQSLLCQTGWIDGKPATAQSGRKPFLVYDPSTDQVWAHQEDMDENDTDRAIAVATAAFPAWAKLGARSRARLLVKFDAVFREAREDLAQLVVLETGKALSEARGEVDYAGMYSHIRSIHRPALG
jgi:succinate-semialdehyde dehydrogenase/glutarate-semialdehyde dehydrogenase